MKPFRKRVTDYYTDGGAPIDRGGRTIMSQPFTLNLLGRKYTDVGAAITYLLVMFGTMGIAAYGGSKAHKNISLIFSDCNSQSVSHFLRGLPPPLADDPTDTLWPDMISAAPFSGVSLAMAIPLGITYALWSGIGIVAIVLVGLFAYKQVPSPGQLVGIATITAGVIIVNLTGKHS